jgi:hypothetical protein
MFREGQAPERRIDPSLDRAAPSPGEGFKRGFVVMTFSPRFFGGAAEFSSASIHLSNAIKDVYAQWESQRGHHPGMLPVIACTGAEPMKDKYGTNYRPKFEIVKWVNRPASLPDEPPVEPSDVWQGTATPSRPQATPVSPPGHGQGQATGRAPVQTPVPAPARPPSGDPMLETEF